jgi:glycosyltransferase involved in cell wall biosynthesis
MSVTPDISVVMSVYNGAMYLRETCDSVLSQKGVNLEFIVVNDGSTDTSGEILQRYVSNDSRVIVIENHNQGLTLSLSQGCLKARGRYIARQDVGDTSQAERLRLQRAVLDQFPQTSFVSSWTTYEGPNGEYLFTIKSKGKAKDPIDILPATSDDELIDGPTSHPSVMFRKDDYMKVGGYRREFYFAQDFDLWLRLAEVGMFQMLEAPLYLARITPSSLSSSNKETQEALGRLAWDAFRARKSVGSEHSILEQASMLRPRQDKQNSSYRQSKGYYFIGETLRRNNDDRAVSYLSQAVKKFPFSVKPWLRLAQARLRKVHE